LLLLEGALSSLEALGFCGATGDGAVDIEDEWSEVLVLLLLYRWMAFVAGGPESVEKSLAEVGQDGGAASGDAVLDEQDGELGEKRVNAGGGLESRKEADKGGREIFVVVALELKSHMTETEAGGGIQDGQAAAATGGGEMAAAIVLLGGCLAESFGLALGWLGQGSIRGGECLVARDDTRRETAGRG